MTKTIFDVAGFNGKRHWPNDVARGEKIVDRLSAGRIGADVIGANELNGEMLVGIKRGGFAVHHGGSNDKAGRPWAGNAVAWDHKIWAVEARGQMKTRLAYWPGKKFRGRRFVWFWIMTAHFPMVRLRNKRTGERIVVMAVHFPTPFNAKPKTRAKIEAKVVKWLQSRTIPAIVVGDTNRMDLRGRGIRHLQTVQAVGIWTNGDPKLIDNSVVNLTGLTDHPKAPRSRLEA